MMELTQAQLADDLGISRQSLISLEKGKCRPSVDLASEIADFFAMPIESIFPFDNYHKESKMPWSSSSPFREIARMHEEIDKIFDDPFFYEKRETIDLPKIIEKNKLIKIILPLSVEINQRKIKIKIEKEKLIIEIPKKK
jgi:putative transcriptional regulator